MSDLNRDDYILKKMDAIQDNQTVLREEVAAFRVEMLGFAKSTQSFLKCVKKVDSLDAQVRIYSTLMKFLLGLIPVGVIVKIYFS